MKMSAKRVTAIRYERGITGGRVGSLGAAGGRWCCFGSDELSLQSRMHDRRLRTSFNQIRGGQRGWGARARMNMSERFSKVYRYPQAVHVKAMKLMRSMH